MLKTGSTRFGYVSKLVVLILMIAVMAFYIVPVQNAFAAPEDCDHVCGDGTCSFIADIPEVPAVPEIPCDHDCGGVCNGDEDDPGCAHSHADGNCSFKAEIPAVPAVPGTPCDHVHSAACGGTDNKDVKDDPDEGLRSLDLGERNGSVNKFQCACGFESDNNYGKGLPGVVIGLFDNNGVCVQINVKCGSDDCGKTSAFMRDPEDKSNGSNWGFDYDSVEKTMNGAGISNIKLGKGIGVSDTDEPTDPGEKPEPEPQIEYVSYIVHYFLLDTTTKVAQDKIITEQVLGSKVTEKAIKVTGHSVFGAKTITIENLKESDNEIIFYYTAAVAPITDPDDGDDETPASMLNLPGPSLPPASVAFSPLTTIASMATPLSASTTQSYLTKALTPEIIRDGMAPLAAGSSSWALLNLILTIVTALIMVALIATCFQGRIYEEDGAGGFMQEKIKRHMGIRLISVVTAVIAAILFLLTQDMRLPMVFIDKFTVGHMVVTVATLVVAILSMKKYDKDYEVVPERDFR